MEERKQHWENIYGTKKQGDFSWYQERPEPSLDFIRGLNLPKDAAIIDIGGGDTFLVDFLLADGFTNLTVLDISEKALERAKERLGENAEKVNWVVGDISEVQLKEKYDLWHDRAALHFLTDDESVGKYVANLRNSLNKGAFVVLGTFSKNGPTKCSGIEIRQYSEEDLKTLLKEDFEPIKCKNVDHYTPSGAVQNFSFCSFQKKG